MKQNTRYGYIILIAAVGIQMCLGATYSWAIFVEPLRELLHKGQASAQLPFSVFYNFFPLTMIFSGFILARLGLRATIVLGIGLFGAGWVLAGLFGTSIAIICICIGVIAGIGAGLAYLIPIKVCMQWFPRHKGLATGVAVTGFGGGSALLSQLGRYIMETFALSPLAVMQRFGILFLTLGTVSALLLKSPPGLKPAPLQTIKPKRVITSRQFLLLYAGMFSGLAGGFVIIANLKQIFAGATPLMGATAVSFFAIFNALGRIIWGTIYDWTRASKTVIVANLLAQAMLLILETLFLDGAATLYIFSAIAGFNYGGVLVLYAAEVGRRWGAERVPIIYGWIFSANIPGALSPVFAGVIYDSVHVFTPAFIIIALYMASTAALFARIYPARDDARDEMQNT